MGDFDVIVIVIICNVAAAGVLVGYLLGRRDRRRELEAGLDAMERRGFLARRARPRKETSAP